MWNYTDKVMEHFRNPRNVGSVENPDGAATVGSLACGDALNFSFKLDGDGRICEAKFKTFGCASAIASSSVLTELVLGKTVEQAALITDQDIADYLGGLPDQKMHCSVMGREALEAAIHNYRTGEDLVHEDDENIVCKCFGVSEEEIVRVVREHNLDTVAQITNFTKAGGGCGMCVPDLEDLLRRVVTGGDDAAAVERGSGRKLSNIQRMQLIQDVIEREIRPVLRRDQGDIELIDIIDNRVIIAFRGMCSGCVSAEATRYGFIEAKLREYVSDDIVVEEE